MKYFLVLEKRPKDYMPIILEELFSYEEDFKSIKVLDLITSKFSKEELINKVKDSNIVTEPYLKGEFFIVDEFKFKYPVIFKDTFNNINIIEYINSVKENKNILNSIYNIYAKNNDNLDEVNTFKSALNNNDLEKILDLLKKLPYLKIRELKFYIKENLINL